jgi:hypothetical protein
MIMTTKSPEHASSSMLAAARSKTTEPMCQLRFPFQLHDMLSDANNNGFEDVVSWLPCGTVFKILDQDWFEKYMMPAYFSMSKYGSFQRQLNLYEFRRVRRGPNKGKNMVCSSWKCGPII